MARLFAALTLAVLLAACGDHGPKAPSIAGHWIGTTNTGLTFDLVLTQERSAITGFGVVRSTGAGNEAIVDGSYHSPSVTLFVDRVSLLDFAITGTHSGNTITGEVSGLSPMTLTRQ